MTKPKRKLVDKVQGSDRRPKGTVLVGHENADRPAADGIWIDGALYPLEGQPPVATTQGWGVIPGRG